MNGLLWFLLGFFTGTWLGIFVMALLHAASEYDDDSELWN